MDGSDNTGRRQELRIALVMTGGVSLCVWMGGVARELDRLLRRDSSYGVLPRLWRRTLALTWWPGRAPVASMVRCWLRPGRSGPTSAACGTCG
jgi:hypothetical protein